MASVKNIVKVMNFHSLIRVDKARKVAEEYFDVEQELTKMMYKVIYNKNLVLDKKILVSNNKGTVIDIYLGNDLGFCGNFNHQLLQAIEEDNDNEKIIVGKKIFPKNDNKVLLKITKEDFFQNYQKIENIIYEYKKAGINQTDDENKSDFEKNSIKTSSLKYVSSSKLEKVEQE